jgi:hypothetical protein
MSVVNALIPHIIHYSPGLLTSNSPHGPYLRIASQFRPFLKRVNGCQYLPSKETPIFPLIFPDHVVELVTCSLPFAASRS